MVGFDGENFFGYLYEYDLNDERPTYPITIVSPGLKNIRSTLENILERSQAILPNEIGTFPESKPEIPRRREPSGGG